MAEVTSFDARFLGKARVLDLGGDGDGPFIPLVALATRDGEAAGAVGYTNLSGVTATGAQQIADADPDRRGLSFQNLSDQALELSFGEEAATGPGALKVPPMGYYEPPAHGIPWQAMFLVAVGIQAYTLWVW